MAIFGGGDLLDYTYLQKRGLIKKSPQEKQEKVVRTKDGFVDLSSMNLEKKEPVVNKTETPSNPFGSLFDSAVSTLNNSAPVSSESLSSQPSGLGSFFDTAVPLSNSSSNNSHSNDIGISSSDINAMKIKVEDLEYKLSNLLDKLSLVESKLESFEKKVFN